MNNSLIPPDPRQLPVVEANAVPALPSSSSGPVGPLTLESFDLDAIWSALWRQKLLLGISTLVVGGLVWLATGRLTPQYEAVAYLRIDGDGLDVLHEDRRDPTRYVDSVKLSSNVESMGGLSVMRAAAAAAGLRYYAEFNPQLNANEKRGQEKPPLGGAQHDINSDAELITATVEKVTISQVGQSGVAQVAVRAEDPVVAARAADAVGQAFIDEQVLSKRKRRLNALDALSAQRRAMLDRLAWIEQNVVAVRRGNLILFNDVRDMRGETFEDIRKSLIQSEAELAEEVQKRQLLDQIQSSGGRLGDASFVTFSALLESLRTQQAALQAKLTEATSELGPRHPRVEQAEESLRQVQRAINLELSRIDRSVRNREKVIESRVETLRAKLSRLETDFKGQTEGKVNVDRLESEATALRTSAEKLDADLDIIKTSIGLEQSEAQFVSAALVPERSVYPPRSLISGTASVAWVGLMVLVISTRALASPRLQRLTDLLAFEQTAGVRAIGFLPRVRAGLAPLMFEENPTYARELKKIAARIDVSPRALRTFIVCSARAGDGGTSVAASLAVLSARCGAPTIVVELDSRGKLAPLLEADQRAGLSDCLRLGIDPLAAVAPSSSDRIHVLGHGRIQEGSLSLAGTALEKVYEKLKGSYKTLVVLAPPLDHAWPRVSIEVDSLIIVSQADRRRAGLIHRYLSRLSSIRTESTSIVLNLVDAKEQDHLPL